MFSESPTSAPSNFPKNNKREREREKSQRAKRNIRGEDKKGADPNKREKKRKELKKRAKRKVMSVSSLLLLLDLGLCLSLADGCSLLLGGSAASCGADVGLGAVDGLHEDTLVTVHVTLCADVESAVLVLVDLARLAVLAEETAEDAHAADPEALGGHAGLLCALAGTVAHVAALALGLLHLADAGTGVHLDRTADDEAVVDEPADVAAGVGLADLSDLEGVNPDTLLATAEDGGCKTLLNTERDHVCNIRKKV